MFPHHMMHIEHSSMAGNCPELHSRTFEAFRMERSRENIESSHDAKIAWMSILDLHNRGPEARR